MLCHIVHATHMHITNSLSTERTSGITDIGRRSNHVPTFWTVVSDFVSPVKSAARICKLRDTYLAMRSRIMLWYCGRRDAVCAGTARAICRSRTAFTPETLRSADAGCHWNTPRPTRRHYTYVCCVGLARPPCCRIPSTGKAGSQGGGQTWRQHCRWRIRLRSWSGLSCHVVQGGPDTLIYFVLGNPGSESHVGCLPSLRSSCSLVHKSESSETRSRALQAVHLS